MWVKQAFVSISVILSVWSISHSFPADLPEWTLSQPLYLILGHHTMKQQAIFYFFNFKILLLVQKYPNIGV